MKRILINIITLLLIVNVHTIHSENTIYCNEGDISGDTITFNTDVNITSASYNDYGIYTNGDLNIIVNGNINITCTNGIYVGGQCSISGSGTINITSSSYAFYSNSPITNSPYIKDNLGNIAYFNDDYHTYSTYDNRELNVPITNLIIKDSVLADISKIDSVHTKVYKGSNEYKVIDGFILYVPSDNSMVTYESTLNTHYVYIWNDFDEDNLSCNYIEFLFDKSEWGKTIKYKVLDVKNFNKDYDNVSPYVKDEEVYLSVIGNDVYTDSDSNILVSNFITFTAYTDDNVLSLKLIGDDPTYKKYINIYVKQKPNDPPNTPPSDDYVIVNTGVR